MQDLPHRYHVTATAAVEGDVGLSASRLPELRSASPAEFGGPGDRWSPETLLTGAVADCFILTFRAVARASKLEWTALRCEATGTLERIDRVTQFTNIDLRVRLTIPAGVDQALAHRALEKAEHGCLVSNSLKAPVRLESAIELAPEPAHV
jgi:organic hydroperoxide reductase OsmC/OhrA